MLVWSAEITYKSEKNLYGTVNVSYNICLNNNVLYRHSIYCLTENVAELIELKLNDLKLEYEIYQNILVGTKITI